MFWHKRALHSNEELINELEKKTIIRRKPVKEAMGKVDRKNYVLDRDWSVAYNESPQYIGYNATISAPIMHAYATEALLARLKNGAKVLDVGSGSGYLCAVFHRLVGDSGKVIGVEHIPELVSLSEENLRKDGFGDALDTGAIELRVADGRLGYPKGGPYDAIHVGASPPKVPQELIDQLACPGTMFIPVGIHSQVVLIVHKDENGEVTTRQLMNVMYVPLTSKEEQEREGKDDVVQIS